MQQVFAIVFALILIPVLLKFKLSTGYSLMIAAVISGFIGKLTPMMIVQDFLKVFTVWSNLSSVLIVIEIAMLGALMTHYGLFKRAEDSLKLFLPRPRLIIMLMPAMVGMLQVPGGAALSAPFCNNLGTEMGLSRTQRANNNVICRHIFMLFAPFSTCVVMAVSLAPEMDVLPFLLMCFVFTAVMTVGNYVFFLRKSQPIDLPHVSAGERVKNLGIFLLMLSPIFLTAALNAIFGMSYVFAVPIGGILVFLLSDKKDFLRSTAKTFKSGLAIMIVGVYFFQNIVKDMTDLQVLVQDLLTNGSGVVFLVVVALASLLFGLASGLMYTPLGVLVPIIAAISTGGASLVVDMFYVFCWSYIGYVFSPLHMCQLLSDKECGCQTGERYKTYIPMIILLVVASVGLYLLFGMVYV